jgi:hypothetical protein
MPRLSRWWQSPLRQSDLPALLAVQVFRPAAAAVGEVLAMGDQGLMQMAGEERSSGTA